MLTKYTTPNYGDGYVYSTGAVAMGIFCGMIPILGLLVMSAQTLLQAKGGIIEVFDYLYFEKGKFQFFITV